MTDTVLACNGCTQCCRGPLRMCVVYPDEDHTQWETVELPRSGWRILAQHPNGDCVYVTEGGCSTWNNRPRECRTFDCRAAMADPAARQLWPNLEIAARLLMQRMTKKEEDTAYV